MAEFLPLTDGLDPDHGDWYLLNETRSSNDKSKITLDRDKLHDNENIPPVIYKVIC